MKALILKDFILSKKIIWIVSFFLIFWGSLGTLLNPAIGSIIYIYLAFFIAYYCVIILFGYDEKVDSDAFINSLPVKRIDVVISRYAFILIYSILICLCILAISKFIDLTPFKGISKGRFFSPVEVIVAMAIIMGFMSIYLPFNYFSTGKVKAFNQIFYIFLIIAPGILFRFVGEKSMIVFINFLQELNSYTLIMLIIFIAIVLYSLSMLLSMGIYRTKDL